MSVTANYLAKLPSELQAPVDVLASSAYQLLHSKQYQELNTLLNAEAAASLMSPEREAAYVDLLGQHGKIVFADGASVLQQLRDWQAQDPYSAAAYLLEASYWHYCYQRVYSYSEFQPQAALAQVDAVYAAGHFFTSHLIVAALNALARAPQLWAAPAVVLLNFSLHEYALPFEYEQSWLTPLLQTGAQDEATQTVSLPREDSDRYTDDCAGLTRLLAQAGLDLDSALTLPQQLPAGLSVATQNAEDFGWQHAYWHAAAHARHPTLFAVLEPYIDWQLRCLGVDAICEFLAAPAQSYLDAQQRCILEFAYFERWMYHATGPSYHPEEQAEFAEQVRLCQQQLTLPLRAGQRQNVLKHLFELYQSEQMDDEMLATAAAIVECGPIGHHRYRAHNEMLQCDVFAIAVQFDAPWLCPMLEAAATARATTTACILYAQLALSGECGFAENPAVAHAWFDEVLKMDPHSTYWSDVAMKLLENDAAIALNRVGLTDGNPYCARELAQAWRRGEMPETTREQAIAWFELAEQNKLRYMDLTADLLGLYAEQASSCRNTQARQPWVERGLAQVSQAQQDGDLDDKILASFCRLLPHIHAQSELESCLSILLKFANEEESAYAMLALAAIYGDKRNAGLFNYRDGVRWLIAAEQSNSNIAESLAMLEIRKAVFETGIIASMKLKSTRRSIQPDEIPGGQ